MIAVMVGQLGILTATTRLLFPDKEVRKAFMKEFGRATVENLSPEEITKRVALSSTWQNWAFIATLSFGMAGLLEELLKASWIYSAKNRSKCTGKPIQKTTYLDFTVTSALSFGLLEGIGFLYAAVETQKETGLKLFRTIAERFLYGSTSHVLLAALTGLRAARKDLNGDKLSWWGVVAPSVFFHGCGNTAAFTFSKLEGNVGFIHPTGFWNQVGLYLSLASVNAVAGWMVYKEWTGLQRRSPNTKSDKDS
jgi:RsiW-degrading membrane proteinase PrsW (M82 family)